MLCHLSISEYLEGGCSTRLLTKCSGKPAVKLSRGRYWLLAYPLAPERCSWFSAYRELCLLTQRLLLLSWQPERKTKPARMDWPVWLKDLFTHTSVHTCMPHHTHIGTDRHAHTSTLKHMQIHCAAHKCRVITFPLIFRVHDFSRFGCPQGNLANTLLWSLC